MRLWPEKFVSRVATGTSQGQTRSNAGEKNGLRFGLMPCIFSSGSFSRANEAGFSDKINELISALLLSQRSALSELSDTQLPLGTPSKQRRLILRRLILDASMGSCWSKSTPPPFSVIGDSYPPPNQNHQGFPLQVRRRNTHVLTH